MQYWGKTFEDGQWHHLRRHCIEVAAVMKVLLQSDAALRSRISALSPLDADATENLLIYLACIHDLGKFSLCFQHQKADLAILNGIPDPKGSEHHTMLGVKLWSAYRLHKKIGCTDSRLFSPLAVAALAHHGNPVSYEKIKPDRLKRFFGLCVDDALQFNDEAVSFFINHEFQDGLHDESLQGLSWAAAGLFILSDWIGSNEIWFGPDSSPISISAGWKEASEKAKLAVSQAKILPAASAESTSFAHLFKYLPDDAVPSVLQQAVLDLPEQREPELLILEDLTGGGKTEAAVLAAHRAMRSGASQGLFIGLPTMATANAMYSRLAGTYRRLFKDEDASLILAHGGRALHDGYLGSIVPMENGADGVEDDGRAVCYSWFADNRKKALLAPCGVGTIDQALLGILSSKHQALRLLGLSRSFLIVDEVHAYDAYTGRLLANLLTFHAAQGGSAILLSATLPDHIRRELMEAWAKGRDFCGADPLTISPKEDGFPLLTRMQDRSVQEIALESNRKIDMSVECVYDEGVMFRSLVEVRKSGGCGCWIRNTVADAVAARDCLIEEFQLPEKDVILFHARFTGLDRMKIEQQVLDLFGKESEPEQRSGKILIATQVVEQSLDLDFDQLLSDLAPMELMIQRAGRCHRHFRDFRPQGYESPLMKVLMPDPVDDPNEDWYANLFEIGQYVYTHPALLWRTARLLKEKGAIRLPEEARELVEGAYGAGLEAPAVFEGQELKAEGDESAGKSLAGFLSLNFSAGYNSNEGQWDNDTMTPTRLGEESRQLRLLKVEGGRLSLWAASDDKFITIKDCMRSEVRVSAKKVRQAVNKGYEAEVEALMSCMPDKGRWCECLVLNKSEGDVWAGQALNVQGEDVEVLYSSQSGLEVVC
ncbi:CRISPR-associated helicase Cas3' [Maridesulfovibrio sp.]|uniref:CRISPR-associated helicase Cas3' n=1 Tax=Maridesulfovibrio sp. TaxID=2795000 RepID=UPI0029CA8672|nr:CRISPR-associated helicase Cas3' [Maridesulfovibrio sp.]